MYFLKNNFDFNNNFNNQLMLLLNEAEEFNNLINVIQENDINKIIKNSLELFEDDNVQPNNSGQPNINQEQAIQIAQGLQNGSIKEEDIQKAYKQGQLNDADIQLIQQAMQGGNQDTDNLSPEEKEKMFQQKIDEISNNFMRLALYDKMNSLKDKINSFFDSVKINNEYAEKIKYLENYLDILISLVYNLDVNLLYQLYLLIELKLIEIFNKYLGKDGDPEIDQIIASIEQDLKEKEMKLKLSPENLAQQLINGEITEEDIQELLDQGLISEETVQKIQELIQQLQQNQNQEQEQDQEQEQPQNEDELIMQIAQKLYNNEISADEVLNMFKSGELNQEQFDKIMDAFKQLKNQNSDQDQNNNQSNKKQVDVSYEA